MRISKIMCQHMLCDDISSREVPFCVDCEHPVFSFALEGDGYDEFVKQWRAVVSVSRESALAGKGDMWDSGFVSNGEILSIRYEGKELKSKTTYYVKFFAVVDDEIIESEVGSFTTGLYYSSDWRTGFIGIPLEATPKKDCAEKDKIGYASPYLRKSFTVTKPVVSAKAYATAYGVYELYVNGKKDERYCMAPEWTDYSKSVQYQYYDLTESIVQGENVIGAIIGDGWYAGNIAAVGRTQYGDAPLGFMLHLSLTYEDGSEELILTNDTWKGSSGPIVYTDNQTGEYYDARLEKDGWCSAGFDDSDWVKIIGVYPPRTIGTRIKASIGPQIKVMKTIKPESVCKDINGKYIVNMGQNMVGVAAVKLRGKAGQKVTFRFGEMLNLDGTIYVENLRSALQTDTYVMKGAESGEEFRPHFTFHGFQYIEISGLDYMPSTDDITGIVIYSACRQTGSVKTSNAMVNKLFSNAMWGQIGNFVGVPTDCPQRDERMGWTGDAQVFCKTACYNLDCYGFYDKYVEDILESQKPNGGVTDVVPNVKWPNGSDLVGYGHAAWSDAMFIVPWTVYNMYGDTEILAKNYQAMEKFFKYLVGTTVGYLRADIGYGDWLNIDDYTPKNVIATAYFAYAASIMSNVSDVLGKPERKAYYDEMFENISAAWRSAYMNEEGIVNGDTQCCYLLALKMNLLKPEQIETAVAHLIRTIERKNYHLSTGFVGVSYLLPILCDYGYSDIAYRLLLNDTYPSWGYSIKNGATTIWERWNSYTKENGFGNVAMNSFNHYSLGSVSEWMYAYMGGIRPTSAGFKSFNIKPHFTKRLDNVDVKYDSASGLICSEWHSVEGGYELNVKIPVNTTACIELDTSKAAVLCGGKITQYHNGYIVTSGTYRFIYRGE